MLKEFKGFLTQSNALALAVGDHHRRRGRQGWSARWSPTCSCRSSARDPVGEAGVEAKFVLGTTTDAAGKTTENALTIGNFAGAVIDFVIIAAVVFMITKPLIKPAPAAPGSPDERTAPSARSRSRWRPSAASSVAAPSGFRRDHSISRRFASRNDASPACSRGRMSSISGLAAVVEHEAAVAVLDHDHVGGVAADAHLAFEHAHARAVRLADHGERGAAHLDLGLRRRDRELGAVEAPAGRDLPLAPSSPRRRRAVGTIGRAARGSWRRSPPPCESPSCPGSSISTSHPGGTRTRRAGRSARRQLVDVVHRDRPAVDDGDALAARASHAPRRPAIEQRDDHERAAAAERRDDGPA